MQLASVSNFVSTNGFTYFAGFVSLTVDAKTQTNISIRVCYHTCKSNHNILEKIAQLNILPLFIKYGRVAFQLKACFQLE